MVLLLVILLVFLFMPYVVWWIGHPPRVDEAAPPRGIADSGLRWWVGARARSGDSQDYPLRRANYSMEPRVQQLRKLQPTP